MRRWRTITALLLILALASVTACNPFGGDEEVALQLAEVVRGDLIVSVSGSGNIDISNEAELAFGVGGRVAQIYVEEDDEVSKGDVLAGLDTGALGLALSEAQSALAQVEAAQAEAEVAQAQAKATIDEAEYDLYILKKRHVSYEQQRIVKLQIGAAELQLKAAQLQLEAIELQLETAEQAINEAQKKLDWATITAPFDGIVADVNVEEKDTVSTATIIIHIIDPSRMELNVDVDEIDVAEVKPGQRAIIEVDALPDLLLEGEIGSISLLPEEEGGVVVFEVKINFDAPEGTGLRIGMSASADIVINERSNALLVPDRAIKRDSQGNTVVEVMVNEQIEERTVVTGISDGFETEIVDGLEEGEMVIGRQ